MRDLTAHLDAVAKTTTVEDAKEATTTLINVSEASQEKKDEAHRVLARTDSHMKIVAYAYNYALSGEGLKVVAF